MKSDNTKITNQAYAVIFKSPQGSIVAEDLIRTYVLSSRDGDSPEARLAKRDLVVEILTNANIDTHRQAITIMEER